MSQNGSERLNCGEVSVFNAADFPGKSGGNLDFVVQSNKFFTSTAAFKTEHGRFGFRIFASAAARGMNNEQPFPSDVQNMRFPVRAAANIPASFLPAFFNGDSEAAVTKKRNPSLPAVSCRKINAPEPCGFGFRAFFFVQQYAQLKTARIPVYALSRVIGEPAVSVDF